MSWKTNLVALSSLLLISWFGPVYAQCSFNHTLFAQYSDRGRGPVWSADNMYSGEYLQMKLRANICYRIIVLDTAVRPMHLRLFDANGEVPLGLTATPGGEAMILTYRPPSDQTVLLTLNLNDCQRSWIPVQIVVEQGGAGGPCLPPGDRAWAAPTQIARYLFSQLR